MKIMVMILTKERFLQSFSFRNHKGKLLQSILSFKGFERNNKCMS